MGVSGFHTIALPSSFSKNQNRIVAISCIQYLSAQNVNRFLRQSAVANPDRIKRRCQRQCWPETVRHARCAVR